MAIPDDEVAQVRSATDIVALVGEHAALKRQGRRWVGLCPFHTEKTPSFSVNAEEGFYYCFGCQASGDVITFVREVEHLDFADAVRLLADRAGVALHEDEASSGDARRRRELLDVLERAAQWYHERLVGGPDAGPARDYLRSRGYDGGTVRRFRLGWAPDEWDACCRALGLDERLATGSGLGFVNRRGRLQDAFRGRVLFPVCDPSGRPIAFGGRVLPGSTDPAKYKNSTETPVYAKRRVLYALNWAKDDIVRTGEVVVCEGYTDVIGFFQSGVERAVATCGTALGDEHFRLLRNFARRVVLAFDADGAGQSAAGRFYEWERRHEVDVAVAALPPGSDPAEVARRDPEALRRAVTEARPFLQFRVERVLGGADLSTAEGRARAADTALAAVAEHPDDLVRDQYVMTVAERCRLEPTALRRRLEALRQGGGSPPPGGRADGPRSSPHGPVGRRDRSSGEPGGDGWVREPDDGSTGEGWGEGSRPAGGRPHRRSSASASTGEDRPGLEALRLAIHRPEEVFARLEDVLFLDEVQREAFCALAGSDDLHAALAAASGQAQALLARLAVEEPVGVADEVVLQLVRNASRRALGELTRAAAGDPGVATEAAEAASWLHGLDDPASGRAAAERLVAWLRARERAT
jgi:DNA primase